MNFIDKQNLKDESIKTMSMSHVVSSVLGWYISCHRHLSNNEENYDGNENVKGAEQWLCACVINICKSRRCPLHNNNVNGPTFAYSRESRSRQQICCISFWNWSLELHIQFAEVFRPIDILSRFRWLKQFEGKKKNIYIFLLAIIPVSMLYGFPYKSISIIIIAHG